MNKTKRNIIQLRTNLVRKMASQIQPFSSDIKWLNPWYIEYAKTPLQVRNEIIQMKRTKVNKIFYSIVKNGSLDNTWGNLFNNKSAMIIHVCKKDSHEYEVSYHSFLDGEVGVC
jgi:hypothetical protein